MSPHPLVYPSNHIKFFTHVLQVFLVVVETRDSLHQFPFLTAALVVHKVPGQNLLQLPDTQSLNIIHRSEV